MIRGGAGGWACAFSFSMPQPKGSCNPKLECPEFAWLVLNHRRTWHCQTARWHRLRYSGLLLCAHVHRNSARAWSAPYHAGNATRSWCELGVNPTKVHVLFSEERTTVYAFQQTRLTDKAPRMTRFSTTLLSQSLSYMTSLW